MSSSALTSGLSYQLLKVSFHLNQANTNKMIKIRVNLLRKSVKIPVIGIPSVGYIPCLFKSQARIEQLNYININVKQDFSVRNFVRSSVILT